MGQSSFNFAQPHSLDGPLLELQHRFSSQLARANYYQLAPPNPFLTQSSQSHLGSSHYPVRLLRPGSVINHKRKPSLVHMSHERSAGGSKLPAQLSLMSQTLRPPLYQKELNSGGKGFGLRKQNTQKSQHGGAHLDEQLHNRNLSASTSAKQIGHIPYWLQSQLQFPLLNEQSSQYEPVNSKLPLYLVDSPYNQRQKMPPRLGHPKRPKPSF